MCFTIGAAEKHEPAAAQVTGLGMDNCERESSGDGGIDGVSSSVEHFYSGARGQFVNAGDDSVLRMCRPQRRGRSGSD
jgi:hypothetical protein